MVRLTQKLSSWLRKGIKRHKPTLQPPVPAGSMAAASNTPAPAPEGIPPTRSSATVPLDVAHDQDKGDNTTDRTEKDIQMAISNAEQGELHNVQEERDIAEQVKETFQIVGDTERTGMPQHSKLKEVLDVAHSAVDVVEETMEAVNEGVELTRQAFDSNTMQPIRDLVVNKVVDGLPGLLKLLEAVAAVHPFIAIAVGAFRVVMSLEQKRRDNNNKIAVLFVKMREMMEALLDLCKIKDKDQLGPDGQTIEARMQSYIKQTVEDIKECANACDAYGKQRLIGKVIYSTFWDKLLGDYVKTFVNRRKDFTFALLIHIGTSQDETKRRVEGLDLKIDIILKMFSNLMSPEEPQLEALVRMKGGPNVVKNDSKALKELLNFRLPGAMGQEKHSRGLDDAEHKRNLDSDDPEVVKQELLEHPQLAIKNNLKEFERKFEMQQVKLEEMKQMLQETLHAVKSGAHDGIMDEDIKMIWAEMRWPRQVKARHFVLALQEHYHRQTQRKREASPKGLVEPEEDLWALEWINLGRLQSILEAFDDDGSGFVTIAEVNEFTMSRTRIKDLQWSLPHWLAYWAIGWQMTATMYRDMIDDICSKMFAIRSHIHPANRNAVNSYLWTVWQSICTLTSSFVGSYQARSLQQRFGRYVQEEENRLRQGLEKAQYDIDAMDTLLLITGPGRIEKYLFPLLWLVLQRDFKILRLCQKRVIHGVELRKSCRSIRSILQAVTQRHNSLEALFKQQKLDPGAQFKISANKLFDYWHDPTKFWSLNNLRKWVFLEVEYYDDSKEDQDLDGTKLLDYSDPVWFPYNMVQDSINDAVADDAVHRIVGRWMGIDSGENGPILRTFCIHATPVVHREANTFWARGTNFNIQGDYTKTKDTIQYAFAQAFTETYMARLKLTIYWAGTLAVDGETLSGKWGYKKDDQPYKFVYKRALHKRFHDDLPHGKLLEQLRKEMDGRLTNADFERLLLSVFDHLRSEMDVDHMQCSHVLQDFRQRTAPVRSFAGCDHCNNEIYGTRVVCIGCGSRTTFDFCDRPECMGCTVKTRDDITSPHLPSHGLVKIRASILDYREIGKVLRNAKAGLERATQGLLQGQREKKDGDELASSLEKRAAPRKDEITMTFTLTCLRCDGKLSHPCWHCIDCPGDAKTFICWECDEREGGFSHGEHHRATHNLVRCMESKEEVDKVEKRLDAVDQQLEGLTIQMKGLTSQTEAVSSQLTVIKSQMEGIENILRSLGNVPAE